MKGRKPWNTGKKMSEKFCATMRIANKGKNLGNKRPDAREQLAKWKAENPNPMLGKKRPDLAERNRSKANRAAVSKKLKGRKFSKKHIANICKAQQARRARAA